ncbi:RNA polymerase sigma-70 factor (ECF subfamily) [Crossiella equi]|uniref:RNA polymerase sigma-70 factor (ECF subfamily) n=1 Tax=Crossiella equi TaxID=130796 RepID=A0ABS5ASG6_9PSEU|nr:sigma-70 family RNA polymerase sigma factor [Crossiella equi]MBP2479139.1 RNA polymerase sigma-70 factor (ECF subfamily) [Crossiella equi]
MAEQVGRETIAAVFRAEYGRAVSVLTRTLGDLDHAEEAVQEAFATALAKWPETGLPPSPAGWIITTARNRAIDRLRREATREDRHAQAELLHAPTPGEEDPVGDDRLRLVFTCCHPALAPAARVALTLRMLGGLSTAEIARAFLTPEPTMAQRISRAKAKIRDARIPYRVPREAELPARLRSVLAVLYLVFNQGHLGDPGLAAEAIRLTRVLTTLMPDEPEAHGLLALLLLTESRRAARTTPTGELVPLSEQDRASWDQTLVDEGRNLVETCLRRGQLGPYQLQAAITAVHSQPPPTDWARVVGLYDLLLHTTPTPVVALNRAVAVAELDGPAAALPLVEDLDLPGYYLWHAIRADLLRRTDQREAALAAYGRAAELATTPAEQAFLNRRRTELRQSTEDSDPIGRN